MRQGSERDEWCTENARRAVGSPGIASAQSRMPVKPPINQKKTIAQSRDEIRTLSLNMTACKIFSLEKERDEREKLFDQLNARYCELEKMHNDAKWR